MANDRTTITELATALGFTGHTTLVEAVEACPDILKIESDKWERLRSVHRSGEWARLSDGGRFSMTGLSRSARCGDWAAEYRDLARGQHRRVRGHVEIRWSHRPFCGPPEAKVYLDTPHDEVPGYVDLDGRPGAPVYQQQRLIDDP